MKCTSRKNFSLYWYILKETFNNKRMKLISPINKRQKVVPKKVAATFTKCQIKKALAWLSYISQLIWLACIYNWGLLQVSKTVLPVCSARTLLPCCQCPQEFHHLNVNISFSDYDTRLHGCQINNALSIICRKDTEALVMSSFFSLQRIKKYMYLRWIPQGIEGITVLGHRWNQNSKAMVVCFQNLNAPRWQLNIPHQNSKELSYGFCMLCKQTRDMTYLECIFVSLVISDIDGKNIITLA